jgi:hypothetical protein
MNRMRIFFALACLLFVAFFFSCTKPKNPAPQKFSGCRVVRIKEVENDTTNKTFYNFFYNNDGTIQRIYVAKGQYSYQAYTRYFNYYGHNFKARNIYQGMTTPYSQDSVLTDSANRITGVYHLDNYNYYNYSNSWDLYNYDNVGNLAIQIHHLMNSEYTDTFYWSGGDVASYWDGSMARYYQYAYYPNAYITGNITARLTDMELYGRAIYTPAHVWTSEVLVGYDTMMHYAYQWDSAGKITEIREWPGSSGGINNYKDSWITYECQ